MRLFRRAAFLALALALPLAARAEGLSLKETLDRLGAVLSWDPFSRTGVLEAGRHRLSFAASAPSAPRSLPALLDGTEPVAGPPPFMDGTDLAFPEAFVSAAAAAFSRAAEADRSRFRVAAIIVDPGHGGRDTGATATHVLGGKKRTLVEKELVLDVAKELHARLAGAYPDKRIVLTRAGDTYPTLEKRVETANTVPLAENEAIVFVSVHANASFNKRARGYEVWYLSPEYRRNVIDPEKHSDSAEVLPILNAMMEEEFTTESVMIAREIMASFDRLIGDKSPSRGVKAEEWFVVRNARMPSVLVEIGFITNPEDAALLADETYLRKLSEAIYSGVRNFVTKFERTGGFTAVR